MPPTRSTTTAPDPFTTAPLRHPTIAPPNLRAAARAHQQNPPTSTASTSRLRHHPQPQPQNPLFAPSARTSKPTTTASTRRGTTPATTTSSSPPPRQQQKKSSSRDLLHEPEFVLRSADGGSFVRSIAGLESCLAAHVAAEEELAEAEGRAVDEVHGEVVRGFWAGAPAGSAGGGRARERWERSEFFSFSFFFFFLGGGFGVECADGGDRL